MDELVRSLGSQAVLGALDIIDDGVLLVRRTPESQSAEIIHVNDSFLRKTGYRFDECKGRSLDLLAGPETCARSWEELHAACSNNHPLLLQTITYRKNGEAFETQLALHPAATGQDGEKHFLCILRDVTSICSPERERDFHLKRLRESSDGSLNAVFMLEPVLDEQRALADFRFFHVNPRGEELLRLPAQELAGRKLSDILPAERFAGLFPGYREVFLTGQPLHEELELHAVNCSRVFFEQQVVRIPGGICVNAMDISERKAHELDIKDRERILHRFLEHSPGLAWIISDSGDIIEYNSEFDKAWNGPVKGKNIRDLLSEAEAQIYMENNLVVSNSGEVMHSIEPAPDPLGGIGSYQVIKFPLGEFRGERVTGGFAFPLNQSRGLVNIADFVQDMIDTSSDAVIINDKNGTIVEWNKAATRMFGFTREDAVGRTVQELTIPKAKLPEFRANLKDALKGESIRHIRTVRRSKQHENIPVEVNIEPLHDQKGNVVSIAAFLRDMRRALLEENRLNSLAMEDSLTGLPNRTALLERLARSHDGSNSFEALAIFSLESLVSLREIYGQEEFESAIVQTARHLAPLIATGAFVARSSDDEFAVVLAADSEDELRNIVRNAKKTFEEPFQKSFFRDGMEIRCGVYHYEPGEDREEDIYNNAHIALNDAKANRLRDCVPYDHAMRAIMERRLDIEVKLREALRNSEFLVAIQPIVDAEGRALGGECLLRWSQSNGSPVSPAEFIPVLEQTGGILDVGDFVIRQSLEYLQEMAGFDESLFLSVNISARQLRDDNFINRLHKILQDRPVQAQRLHFEITETSIMENREAAIDAMHAIRDLGIPWSLDDFGTGYSSLAYLREMPVETIKIDRSFVQAIESSVEDQAVLGLVATLGKKLGRDTIAEGIEKKEQLQALVAQGVSRFQGFYFGPPMPPQDFYRYCQGKAGSKLTRIGKRASG